MSRKPSFFSLENLEKSNPRLVKKLKDLGKQVKSHKIPLTLTSSAVLQRRYLKKDKKGQPIEPPEEMFWRVAVNIASADLLYDKKADISKRALDFYNLMAGFEFLPNSPTLMNAGRELQQLSACFVLPVGDSMESIFEAVKNTAIIHKTGGGTGFTFTHLRPKNDRVSSTSGMASGPISFMKVFNSATDVIKQGGCVHPDTIISTEFGLAPIKSFRTAKVNQWNKTSFRVPTDEGMREVEYFYNNGFKPTKTIVTKNGYKFTGTFDHKIRVIDSEGNYTWRQLSKISCGDWVVLLKDTFIDNRVIFPEFKYKLHHNSNDCTLPQELTPELSELIGYFVGDGCLSGSRLVFSVCLDDQDVIDKIKILMKLIFQIDGYIQKKRNDNSLCLVFNNKKLAAWWNFVGLKKKGASEALIPKVIMKSNRENVYAFLRGLFEADGTTSSDGYTSLSTISEKLVTELQALLLSISIPTKLSIYNKRANSFGKKTLYKLNINTINGRRVFNEKIRFIGKRKSLKLPNLSRHQFSQNDIIPNISKKLRYLFKNLEIKRRHPLYRKIYHYLEGVKDHRNLTTHRAAILIREFDCLKETFLSMMLSDNRYYDQVISIEDSHSLTLDLSVKENCTYIANGFISHNTRRGANMGILNVDHPDILEFITAKRDPQQLTNFNLSVGVTEDFMERVSKKEDYPLINPHTQKVVGKLNAAEVFDLIVKTAWENGEPGIVFVDRLNEANPTPDIGEIESTNPCGEVPLLPYESCNLGSVNLAKMVKDTEDKWEIDYDKLERTIKLAVRFLDNVVDINKYPLEDIAIMSKNNRKIGLGVMGFADMLVLLKISYNSEDALKLAESLMKFIQAAARDESARIAKTRGVFPNFKGSIYDKSDGLKLRNATLTTVAPTGSLSIIAGCSSGIEPVFALCFVRQILSGDKFLEVNPYFEKALKDSGIYSPGIIEKIDKTGSIQNMKEIPESIRKVFVTAYDIAPIWHIKMQAAFQKYTDNAVSKTVNFPESSVPEDIREVFWLAYHQNCKGVTIYRYGSRKHQVLSLNSNNNKLM